MQDSSLYIKKETLSSNLSDNLFQNYIDPFLKKLKLTNLNEREFIQKMLYFIHHLYKIIQYRDKSSWLGTKMNPPDKEDISKIIDLGMVETPNMVLPYYTIDITAEFKHLLYRHNLRDDFLNLADIYIDSQMQKRDYPGLSKEIRSSIRELFFNYLNPLPFLNREFIIKQFAPCKKDIFNGDNVLFSLPLEYQMNVFSNLTSFEDRRSLRQTCKAAFFVDNLMRFKEDNIFYAFYTNLFIESNSILKYNYKNLSIYDKKLFYSISADADIKIQLYPSLFQALEQIRIDNHPLSDSYLIYPLWIVIYTGKPSDLKFTQNYLTQDSEIRISGTYDRICKESIYFSTEVEKKSIIPLSGTIIYPNNDFCDYKIINKLDFQKYRKDHDKKTKCTIQ